MNPGRVARRVAWVLGMACCVESIGYSAAPADIDPGRIAAVFADVTRDDAPGCALEVSRNGALMYADGYGMSDIAAHSRITTDSVFNVASVSKQFTAFSILLLAQRGALQLDDLVAKYVPEIERSAPGVTLRHLLHHMGGLRDYEGLLELSGRNTTQGATQFETIALLGRQSAPNSPPGVEYDYSNSGYVVLGTIVERVSGRSLREFEQQNIFTPLGMNSTAVVDRYPAGIARLARGYTPQAGHFDIDESAWEQIGDGQVHTTVADLTRWADNLRTAKVGGPEVIRQMLEPGVLRSGEQIDYALGLEVGQYRGLRTVRHSGAWAGYRAQLLYFPGQRLAIAVLCNRADARPGQRAEAVADLLLNSEMTQAAEPAPAVAAPAKVRDWKPRSLSRYSGIYWSDEAQARCNVLLRGGKLVLETCAAGVDLQAGAPNEFVTASGFASLRFSDDSARPAAFLYFTPGIRGLRFVRQP